MSELENSRSCGCESGEKQDGVFQPKYDGSFRTWPGKYLFPPLCWWLHQWRLTNHPTVIAQQEVWQEWWSSHSSAEGYFPTSPTSLLGIWIAKCESIRAHQAKPVPWAQYHARSGIRATTAQWVEPTEQSPIDSLRLEARKHSAKEVSSVQRILTPNWYPKLTSPFPGF